MGSEAPVPQQQIVQFGDVPGYVDDPYGYLNQAGKVETVSNVGAVDSDILSAMRTTQFAALVSQRTSGEKEGNITVDLSAMSVEQFDAGFIDGLKRECEKLHQDHHGAAYSFIVATPAVEEHLRKHGIEVRGNRVVAGKDAANKLTQATVPSDGGGHVGPTAVEAEA